MSMFRRTRRVLLAMTVIAGLQPVALAHAGPPPTEPAAVSADAAAPAGPGDDTDAATAVADARVSADVLMDSYDQQKAWFASSWWNSAVALQTIGDYMARTGDRRYLAELDHSFETNKGPFPAGERSTDEIYGNFTSRAIDDSGWWGLNWVTAYDLTGDEKYLDMAVTIGEFMNEFWDTSTCGGGIWWNEERTYKNAVTNGQWVRLTAELHNRLPGDTLWLDRSQEAWDWYVGSGMINANGLVNDGLRDDCSSNDDTVWTYNQGLGIGAALELWRATGDPELLDTAKYLADSALASDVLVKNGVLTEWCEAAGRSCDDNQKQFKGIFQRYLMELADATGEPAYTQFVADQAASVWANDRDVVGRLGLRWAGGTAEQPNVFDWRTQASALSALIADVPREQPRRTLSAAASPAVVAVMPSSGQATRVGLDVGVAATSARPEALPVTVRTTGPRGWKVTADRTLRLNPSGHADPARATVPVDVRIPAGTADGSYPVSVTVTARSGLTYTARAEVLVAAVVDFAAGSPEEIPWLFDAGGSGFSGGGSRYADGESAFVYRFPFPAGTTSAQATLTIDNQYVAEVSPDGESWTTVLAEDEQIRDGSNRADHTLDLTEHLGADKAAYIRVSDAFPADGWGGGVYHVTAAYETS
ncbi:glycoside hydrolase family 76 protein [Promicromonospora sp. NPDC019610]|uniref:glycoside hydrolase family 76 protein n=1 Tax=Promicromonospora sp. NPDC019610 TaxID=3364405 RepID=UPI003790B1D6